MSAGLATNILNLKHELSALPPPLQPFVGLINANSTNVYMFGGC